MSDNKTAPDWSAVVYENASRLSKAMEIRFNNRLATTVQKVLGKEELSEDHVVERTGAVINQFFDALVGTTVGLICKKANSSEDMEERVVANVRRWFKGIREMEKKDGNH